MTNKLPNHRDLDSELLPLASPVRLFWSLAALATALIFVSTWLALLAAMAAGLLAWSFVPYVWAPIGAWLVILALPVLWHSRRGAVAIVAALAMTAEAWLARAGYSIDLNQDGAIGHVPPQVTIERPQIERPILITSQATQGYKLLAHAAGTIPAFWDTGDGSKTATAPAAHTTPAGSEYTEPAPTRLPKLWQLPSGARVPTETIITFVEGVFIRGWGRAAWVGKGKQLERGVYDELIGLLEATGVLVDRKQGAPGRLAVDGSQEALRRLGLAK